MPPSAELSPPGSATYNSATMMVGDGTWDSERNTFLLPNLQALNFDTMRYNGMGNRFKDMPQYHDLIRVHGILAAITFLFLVPFAIIFLRFNGRNPWWGMRLHMWCHIFTVLLSTAVFVLGYFAVGPSRSLTNPHHSIGVALYVLVLTQFILGWWTRRREKRKMLPYTPLKTVLHKWLGRTTALLGIIQIPLGLTLYGSPAFLFILYTITVFLLVLIYFVLSYIREKNLGRDLNSDHSWVSGSGSAVGKQGMFGKIASGVGIGALASRFHHRDNTVASRHTGSYLDEEKYSQYGQDPDKEGGWKKKVLGLGVIAAAAYWAGKLLGRRAEASGDGTITESSGDSLGRLEDGQPSPAAHHPLNPPLNPALGHRRSRSSLSYDSYMSSSPSRQRPHHGMRNAAVGLGTFGFARNFFKKRRDRKEQRRIDELRQQEIEDEKIQRANSRKYTGDGFARRHGRRGSQTSTNLTPIPGEGLLDGGLSAGAIGSAANPRHDTTLDDPFVASGALPINTVSGPPPPIHDPNTIYESSGSELYASSGGQNHRRHRTGAGSAGAVLAGGAAGIMAGEAIARRRDNSQSRRHSGGTGSVGSPPVSVKLNMHSDGRHVTLRRLTEEEAAAERVRQSRNGSRRRRGGSASSLSGPETGPAGERWRRTEARERQEQLNLERQQLQASQAQLNTGNLTVPLPPPPPIPSSVDLRRTGTGSIGSPGTYDGTATEASTNYTNNRKRRRAERAAATREKQARGGGGRVEFE